jgi:hypothetical protein
MHGAAIALGVPIRLKSPVQYQLQFLVPCGGYLQGALKTATSMKAQRRKTDTMDRILITLN